MFRSPRALNITKPTDSFQDDKGTTKDKRRKVSTAIITDTPEKEKCIAVRRKKVPRKVVSTRIRRKTISESSCDSESCSLSSESDESLVLSLDGCIENCDQIDYFAGDYVVCKVHSEANTSHHFFIGKIIFGPYEEGDCEVKFLQSSRKIKNGFIFPEKEDIASISRNDMTRRLSAPQPSAQQSALVQL